MPLKIGEEPVPGYRLVRFLGRGGFGQVWQATSPGGIHVALKIIDLSGREGLKEFKALRLMKSIRQANLTPILAFWLKDDEGFLVDEAQVAGELSPATQPAATSIQGTVLHGSLSKMRPSELIIAMGLGDKTLSDRLRECQQEGHEGIPAEELFSYMLDAARAIDFLNTPRHDLGHGPVSPIQHCDIKPQNILIVGDTAQVCDFGLARELGANVKMTTAAVSPAYGAPELIQGQPPSSATDQYSLAITYVELRTGALPFADPDSYMHVVNAHLQGGLDLTGLAVEEQAIIRKATLLAPSDRFPSATRMVKALRQACPEEFGSTRAMPYQSRPGSPSGSDIGMTAPYVASSSPFVAAAAPGTTETPTSRGFETKLDPQSLISAEVVQTADLAAAGSRRKSGGRRLLKSMAAILAVAGLVALVWMLIPQSPEMRDFYAAHTAIRNADAEKDLFAKGRLLAEALEKCEPYAAKSEFAGLIDDSKKGLSSVQQSVESRLEGDWKKIEQLASPQSQRDSLQEFIDYSGKFLTLLPAADQISTYHRNAELWRDEIADTLRREDEAKAREFVDRAEEVLDADSQAPAAIKVALVDLTKAESLVAQSPGAADVGFRARLAAARARARSDQLPPAADLEKLWAELKQLPEKLPDFQPKPRNVAHLCVLRALAAKANAAADPEAVLQILVSFPNLRSALPRGQWEHSQLEGLAGWMQQAVKPEARSTEFTSMLRQVVAPVSAEELRNEAETHFKARDFVALTGTLEDARQSKPTGPAAAHFRELGLLATLANSASASAEIDKALAEYRQLLESENAIRLVDLTAALAELSTADPNRLAAAVDSAAMSLQLERDDGQKKQIADILRGLYTRRVAQLVAAGSIPNPQVYFADLRALCQQAKRDGDNDALVNLALAESLAELHRGKPNEAAAETKGLLPHGKLPLEDDQQAYGVYVRLLALLDSDDFRLAGGDGEALAAEVTELAKATLGAAPPVGLSLDHRRQRLAELLVRAAGALRLPAEGAKQSPLSAIVQPYGPDGGTKAEQAYAWLVAAGKLASALAPDMMHDPRLLTELALATWHKPPDGKEAGREEIKKKVLTIYQHLKGKPGQGADQLPLLYVYSLSQPNIREVMPVRAELVDALFKGSVRPPEKEIVELYNTFVAPSIAEGMTAPDPDAAFQKQLARLAYRKGKLIGEYNAIDAGADRKAEVYKSYDLAVAGDPNSAEYLAARGFAGLDLEPPQVDAALADAKTLVRANPGYHGSYGLLAMASLADARRRHDRAEQTALAKMAVDACEESVRLEAAAAQKSGTQDRASRVFYLLHLGESYAALANYSASDSPVPRAKRLETAIEKIKEAQNDNRDNLYVDYAWLTLGNAYEDLASLAKRDVNKNYDEAIKAFNQAKRTAPDPARALTNLGRCYYKREADSHQPGYIDLAEKELTEAIAARQDFAEAYRWLGAVYRYKKQYDKADENFEQALQLAKAQNSSDAATYAMLWARARLDDPAFNQRKVRERAARLLRELPNERVYRQQLAWINGQSWEAEATRLDDDLKRLSGDLRLAQERFRDTKRTEALQIYERALGNDLTKTDALDLDLLRAQGALKLLVAMKPDDIKTAVRDSDRILELTASAPQWNDFHLGAVAYHALWLVEKNQQATAAQLLERSILNFDRAVALAPQEPKIRVKNLLDQYVLQLNDVLADATARKQLTPAAKQLIKKAPDLLQAKISQLGIDKRTVGEFIDGKLPTLRRAVAELQ